MTDSLAAKTLRLVRKAGVMAVVIAGGDIIAGDGIRVELPAGVAKPLVCV